MKSNKANNIDIIISRNGEHSQPQDRGGRVLIDIKGMFEPQMATKQGVRYWRL